MADVDLHGMGTLQHRYIQAYEKNLAARQEWDELRQNDGETVRNSLVQNTAGSKAGPYIQLQRQRRRHEECQVLHRHVQKLSETPAAQPRFLDINLLAPNLRDQRPNDDEITHSPTNCLDETVDDLTERLERAVLKAKHRLEYERQVLEQIKLQHHQQSPKLSREQRLRGLTAVQVELFSWIEEKLATSAEAESTEGPPAEPDDRIDDQQRAQADAVDLESQYDQYLKARRRLLDAAALLSKPLDQGQPSTNIIPSTSAEDVPPDSSLPLLTFIEQRLIPLSHANQDAKMKSSLFSAMLKSSRAQTLQELDRLADESHLLSTYPLSTQSGKPTQTTGTGAGTDGVGDRIRAWSRASEAASKASAAFISEHLQHGAQSLDQADVNISRLQELTGEAPEEEGKDEGEEDIWAGEIQTLHQRAQRIRKSGRSASPWAKLDGTIGCDKRNANA